jgi:glutamyl-tRNA synthetase
MAAGGRLLLRNEDLDPQRSRAEFVSAMLEDLEWLGIRWEPPMLSQSQRLPAYREAFERLLSAGAVYPCSCSRKDLARLAQAPHEDNPDVDDEPLYSGRCRPSSAAPAPTLSVMAGYRFRVPEGETIEFLDSNLGPQAYVAGRDFGDFLIWRRPVTADPVGIGLPSYQLACAVDDAYMGITEVVRGADLLKSTARQILLQRALGLPALDYFHTPLLRDAAGARLAKRHDSLALRTLREQGFTPEQVVAEIANQVGSTGIPALMACQGRDSDGPYGIR